MTFYIYKEKLPIHWANEYKRLYKQELEKLGHTVQEVTTVANRRGVLILGHFTEWVRFTNEKDTKHIRTVAQSNGTSINPFIYQVTRESEKSLLESVNYNLTACEKHANLLKKEFGINNVYPVGFPIDTDYPTPKNKTPGQCVIAGRLTPDKLVYESIRMAMNVPNFSKVIVCYPQGEGYWLPYYPKRPFIEYRQCEHDELINVLSESEYYVISSLGDVSSVSSVEAIQQGCKFLYRDYPELPIPYYQRNVENMEWYNPEKCAKNLLEIL